MTGLIDAIRQYNGRDAADPETPEAFAARVCRECRERCVETDCLIKVSAQDLQQQLDRERAANRIMREQIERLTAAGAKQ